MIDFREEIEKYKPALEIEQLEEAVGGGNKSETQDMMDILQQITKLLNNSTKLSGTFKDWESST